MPQRSSVYRHAIWLDASKAVAATVHCNINLERIHNRARGSWLKYIIDAARASVLDFDRNLFITLAHSGGMMGYRYWTIGRLRAAKHEASGTKRPTRRNRGFEPGADVVDDRLPMSTAVPLWGVFSMLGWLMIAYGAAYLAYVDPQLRAANPHQAAVETATVETTTLIAAVGYARR